MRKIAILLCVLGLSFFKVSLCKKTQVKGIKDKKQFENIVLKSKEPVVVKFKADWCGYCKQMIPIYNNLANKYSPRMKFTTVDCKAAKLKEVVSNYQIRGIPAFIFFRNGKVIKTMAGAMPEAFLEEEIKKVLSSK